MADLSAVVQRYRALPARSDADIRRVYLTVQGFPLVEEENR
jgi:hypothetical protein